MIILCSPPLTRRSHRNQRDGGRPRGGHYGDQVGPVLIMLMPMLIVLIMIMIMFLMIERGVVTMEIRLILLARMIVMIMMMVLIIMISLYFHVYLCVYWQY